MRRGAVASVLTALLVLPAAPAWAQEGIFGGMQKSVESVFSSLTTTTTLANGAVAKTSTTNVYPLLRLMFDTNVYPNLRLNAGGVFELNATSTHGPFGDLSSTITRNRPFFLLRSTNPVFSPGIGYFRREERARTAGLSDIKLVNDEYNAYLGWYPAGGPRSDFQYVRSHTFDGERAFQDGERDYASVGSNYTFRNLGAYYGGSYLGTKDRISGLESRQAAHAGRVNYSGTYLDQRLFWNALYNINHQDLTTLSPGQGGEVAIPVLATSGLSAVSDLPATARLPENAQLIDGNLTAGAGVDLGRPAPGEDAQARNIGLDFVNRTEVNRLFVWVDRDLPAEVAGSFSWDIYSSEDNIGWRRETTVATASFGPFDRRFQIDFSGITARYLKAVTRPLSAAVPNSQGFPDIFVAEVQAFVRRPADSVSRTLSRTNHMVNSDVRMRLLRSPSLFYEGLFLYNGTVGGGRSTRTISNGLSVDHAFGRIFSTFARGAYEQGSEPRGPRTAVVTNATLTVDPIPTFRSSVLFNGQNETIAGLDSDRRGVIVQTFAQPYRGIDLLAGFGWNFTTRETGERARDRLLNVSGTVVPRQHLSLTASYDNTTTNRAGLFAGEPVFTSQRFYGSVAFDPLRTLHLVLGGEALSVTGQRTRKTLDIGLNWAPLPDGTLQFVFISNESLRPLDLGRESHTVGAVRWNVSRQSYIDVSYQRTKTEYDFQTIETRVFSVGVRLYF